MATNPLLEQHELHPFQQIQAKHVVPAIRELIDHNLKAIDDLLKKEKPHSFETLVSPMEEWDDKLHKAWSPVSHLNSVANTPELRQAHHECLPMLSDYGIKVGQNEALFNAYLALFESATFSSLTPAQQKVITNAIRDFKLSGVALTPEKRAEFSELSQTLSKLQSQFQDNVLDATDHWHLDITDIQELKGLSEESLASFKQSAEKNNVQGWRLTLDYPCFHSVITYADNRLLRQKIHEAYSTRASDIGPSAGKWDNTEIMEKILLARYKKAKLLGFSNYAELSLATKMAKDPQKVMAFLKDLAEKTKPFAQKEVEELKTFAKNEFGIENLEPWDVAYYSEKMQQKMFTLSEEMLRPYFPANKVLQGLFEVVKRLYGLSFKEKKDVPNWDKNVQFFQVFDRNQQLIGMFYLDLFARNGKRGGAWMDEAQVRRRKTNQELQLPITYLTCNFRLPTSEGPSLLTHDEVITLFHEFGHGLHQLLTKVEVAGVSGINGVLWDAVELPSQFMENWCWENEALQFISGHYQTQEPLPKDLLDKMQKAKNFQSAMQLIRQLEFSLFDFRIHMEFNPEHGGRIQEILNEVRAKYSVIPVAPYNRFQNSFSHIFGGGYAAGYYSYLWAEVLSSDAYSKFEEEGIFNPATGKAFLEKILEKGGSEEPEVLFRDFRGRDPDIKPLLRHRGFPV